MIIASNKDPPRPNGSRIVIQKLRVDKYHVWRNRDTRGRISRHLRWRWWEMEVLSWRNEMCLRLHDKSKECTRAVESVSASGVRVSIVEMSMRWSAGLTCDGHGKPIWSKYGNVSVTCAGVHGSSSWQECYEIKEEETTRINSEENESTCHFVVDELW